LTADARETKTQTKSKQRVNLEMVYRSLLKIVARFEESTYTDTQLRQTTEVELDDLADPASEKDTSQG